MCECERVCGFDLVAGARGELKFHCTQLQRLLSTSGPQRHEGTQCIGALGGEECVFGGRG